MIDVDCPKCGERMRVVEGSDWQLHERASVILRCPNCGHEERANMRPNKENQ